MASGDQFVIGYLKGLKAGRGNQPFDPESQDQQYRIGYFEGYCDGKEDASSEIWTPFSISISPRIMRTHDWDLVGSEDLGDGMEEVVEVCPCKSKRHSLILRDEDGTVLKHYYFKVRPDPLIRCEYTGRMP